MKQVTKEWLKAHATNGCGFTKAQIEALGLNYPVQSGWIDAVAGMWITEEQAEKYQNSRRKKKKKESAVKQIDQNAIQVLRNIIKSKSHLFTDLELKQIYGCLHTLSEKV